MHELCCGGGAGNHPGSRMFKILQHSLMYSGLQRGRNLLNNARYAHKLGTGSKTRNLRDATPNSGSSRVRRLAINFRLTVNLISCPMERSASAVINFARDACGNAFI